MELKKGRKLNNRYEILKVLKAGGFGITYEAKYIDFDRKVVIKEYYPSSIVNRDSTDTVIPSSVDIKNYEKGLEDFLKEAKALAKFDTNPNIVNITEHFTANGTAYFVMPFEEGEDLARYLDKHGKMSETEILDIIFPILNALEEIHKIGMIHRDIKPANIFMKTNKTPLLIDFGNARYAFGKNTNSLSKVYTRGYAPMEQYDSKSLQGAFTDIYALGATIYTMATYSVPPDSTSRSLAKLNNLADPLKPISSSNFSLEFKNGVHKALNVLDKDRYQSVAEFRKALNGIEDPKDKNNNSLLFIFFIFLFLGGISLFNFLKEPTPVEHNATESDVNISVAEENTTQPVIEEANATIYEDANVSVAQEVTSDEIVTIDGLSYQNQPFSQQDKENFDNKVEGGRVWTWDGAKNYCDNLSLAGYDDWRLLNSDELKKLLTQDYIKNSKGYEHFIRSEFVENMPQNAGFWSITEYHNDYSDALFVNFDYGLARWNGKSDEGYVLCVRGQ